MLDPAAQEILDFWFRETAPKLWFAVDDGFDARIRSRFLPRMAQAAAAELHGWRASAHGRLAEIIVLDQFSRNAWRGTARAFAQDALALVLAQEAVAAGCLAALDAEERRFLLLPYMHSESRAIHAVAEPLLRQHAPPDSYQFELQHKAIIDRFGRYPHRNASLGRESTAEELEFLEQPGSRF